MTTVMMGVREVTRRTSEVFERTSNGETIIVTNRGRAAALPDPGLRTLDAIHLASAVLTPGITTMLVCDKWLADAALSMALTVVSPG